MDEHEHHKRFLGLPPVAWVGIGGLVLLFVYAHSQAGATVSGVALPASANPELTQTGSEAAALQVDLQQESLAAKTAQDQFALQAAQQGLAQNQQAFQTQLFGVQQQQQAQGQANQLALAAGQQQLSQNATQFAEQQKFEQQAYRNNHQGGFTLGTLLNGAQQAFNSALSAFSGFNRVTGPAPTTRPTGSTPPFTQTGGIF